MAFTKVSHKTLASWRSGILLPFIGKVHMGDLAILLLLSCIVRLLTFVNIPLFFTLDSPDYIQASIAIRKTFDFSLLLDTRLPTYPIFLSILQTLFPFRASVISIAQSILGIASVMLGYLAGMQLHSRLTALLLAGFLAVNPLYLLHERFVMTETLYLFLSLLTIACIVNIFHRPDIKAKFFVLGVLLAASTLNRVNGLLFFCILIVGVFLQKSSFSRYKSFKKMTRHDLLRNVLILIVAFMLILSPWLYRNFRMYNNLSILNFNYRNMVLFMSGYDLVDKNLPITNNLMPAYTPAEPSSIFIAIRDLDTDTNQAEKKARSIVFEQISHHPGHYLRQSLKAMAAFVGIIQVNGVMMNNIQWVFRNVINNQGISPFLGFDPGWLTQVPSFHYDLQNHPPDGFSRLYQQSGLLMIATIRPMLIGMALFLAMIAVFAPPLIKREALTVPRMTVLVLLLAYLGLVVFHALTFAILDRFTSMFDWIPILILGLSLEMVWHAFAITREQQS